MLTDDELAALERAASLCEYHGIEWGVAAGQNTVTDAALIRNVAERARNGGERAQIVAWLRDEKTWQDGVNCTAAMYNSDSRNLCRWLAEVIEHGAHMGGDGDHTDG
jgi:hypothetical protein